MVNEELTVDAPSHYHRSDSEIQEAAVIALAWDVWIPKGVTATVRRGWLTLSGEVDWQHERASAERAVRFLVGVLGLTNAISLRHAASSAEVKEKLESALLRQATTDASSIVVGAEGGVVTLSEHASSRHVIRDAVDAAWATAGVSKVVDNVAVNG